MKFFDRMEKSAGCWFLLISSFFFFLLRLPSLFEPYWYGDEGIYQVLGIAIKNGHLLYRDIWDNKPPLLYLIYALFNSDQFAVRLASLVFGIASVIAFYFLAKTLFPNRNKVAFLSTGLFGILFGLPLVEGNIANAENFMLLPIILAALLLIKLTQHKIHSTKYLVMTGFLVSLAFLTKIVAIFDFAAFFLFLLFVSAPINLSIKDFGEIKIFLKTEIKNLLPFLIGFTFPIIAVTLFFLLNGAIKDFISASFVQNVGYVGYGNKFIIPQGLLILKLILLSSFSLFLFVRRNNLSKTFIFISLWFTFSLFNCFFSGRPYTHYVLVFLPSLCLFIGLLLYESTSRKFTSIILVISLILVIKNFNYYGKTIFYYQNYLSFITNKESVRQYRAFFDRKTPRDYELAQFINVNTVKTDNIFIWGNNAQVYALVGKLPPGRYAVTYHITGYSDGIKNTQDGIDKTKPKLIIAMPDVSPIPFPLFNYVEKSVMNNAIIYERIF